MAIQGKIVCTDKAGSGYGIYEQYLKKNHIRNGLILFEGVGGGGVDPKSENHIRNVLI